MLTLQSELLPECFIGHQVYVLDPRWLSSLLDIDGSRAVYRISVL